MTRIVGGYKLIEVVGQGGIGIVYRAHQESLNRDVALKFLVRKDLAAEQWLDGSRRLRDEAQAAAKVQHRGLVEIFDTGEDEELGPYIVYEYLPNGTLREHLDKCSPMGLSGALDLFGRRLLAGLNALHEAGIVHRDVKPSNLLSDGSSGFKLCDLGLAHFEDRNARTQTGLMIGTPGYMAPETYLHEKLLYTPSYDVYSAAIMLVEGAIGYHPYQAPSAALRLRKQLDEPLTYDKLTSVGIAPHAAVVLAQALALEPGKRQQSATQLAVELADVFERKRHKNHPEKVIKKQEKNRRRTLGHIFTVLLLALFCAILFHSTKDVEKSKLPESPKISEEYCELSRLTRDGLIKRKELPSGDEFKSLALFIRQTGIAKRLKLPQKTPDQILVLTYLARFTAKSSPSYSSHCYISLVNQHSIGRLRELGIPIEQEIFPLLLERVDHTILSSVIKKVLSKYVERKEWSTFSLKLAETTLAKAQRYRNTEVGQDIWLPIDERLKLSFYMMRELGWQSYPIELRANMFDHYLSCAIMLASGDIADQVIEHLADIDNAGGPSAIEGISVREGARIWFRGVIASNYAILASTKRLPQGIKLLNEAIGRLENAKEDRKLIIRYKCYLSQLLMRCIEGEYDSADSTAKESLAVIDSLLKQKLSRQERALALTMRANALMVKGQHKLAMKELEDIEAEDVWLEDRWYYHLTLADSARTLNDYELIDKAMAQAGRLVPSDFTSYYKLKKFAMGLESRFFKGDGEKSAR